MIPGDFQYHRPASVDEAVALLGQHGEEAKVLAGGQSLIAMMKLRLAAPQHLIDINRIEGLSGIAEHDGILRIGAMTTQNELIASALIGEKCPLIAEAAEQIADPQVRNRGTIGGDLVHGDPGNDLPAVMMALGATYSLRGADGEREVAADGFYTGIFETGLGPQEILTEIRVPAPAPGSGHAYVKLKRKIGDFATAAAAVLLTLDGEVCSAAAIALTNLAPTAIRVAAAEALLTGSALDDAAIDGAAAAASAASDPTEDLRGSVAYKKQMAGEMTRRALKLALERAKGG